MSALTRFRDHCARMVAATKDRPVNVLGEGRCWPTEDERALWAQLRDEVDDYLTRQPDEKAPVRHIPQDGFDFADGGFAPDSDQPDYFKDRCR